MSAALAIVATGLASAFLIPRTAAWVGTFITSRAGRFFGTWGVFALLYDVFVTAGRPFNATDAALTGGAALVVQVVL